MGKVVFITAILTHYRRAFHEQVRERLAQAGHSYELIYSAPTGAEASKGDTITLPWATMVPSYGVQRFNLLWQSALGKVSGADLVILGQENRFLVNYLLQILPRSWRPALALWGHGRNFQARNPRSLGERWKRLWATRCEWWFAYTHGSGRHVLSLGFPAERITVFNNAVDTAETRDKAAAVTELRLQELRRELGLVGTNVAIFVGGLYEEKRLDFLVAAARVIRSGLPDFELLVVGGGPELDRLRALAEPYAWIKVTGPRFGTEKIELMRLARLFLMPGLVGLAILDAGAAGLPTITTAYPYHSPEIEYLRDGLNGLIVADWQNHEAYAEAITDLLREPERLTRLAFEASASTESLTSRAMADRFVEGVISALAVEAKRAPAGQFQEAAESFPT